VSAWHPAWPGFNARGSLLLPLAPDSHFEALAPTLDLDGLQFARKREFHVTLLDRELGARLRAQEASAAVRPSIRELFEGEDWAWFANGKRWLLGQQQDEGPVHSVIELLDMPALARFRHNVGWSHAQLLPDTPAHVTLYVAGNELGIGLASNAEFKQLRLRRL
jgi:hypothetical protein